MFWREGTGSRCCPGGGICLPAWPQGLRESSQDFSSAASAGTGASSQGTSAVSLLPDAADLHQLPERSCVREGRGEDWEAERFAGQLFLSGGKEPGTLQPGSLPLPCTREQPAAQRCLRGKPGRWLKHSGRLCPGARVLVSFLFPWSSLPSSLSVRSHLGPQSCAGQDCPRSMAGTQAWQLSLPCCPASCFGRALQSSDSLGILPQADSWVQGFGRSCCPSALLPLLPPLPRSGAPL